MVSLLQAFENIPLEKLALSNNEITNNDLEIIAPELAKLQLKELDLDQNLIGNAGLKILFNHLTPNHHLKYLDIGSNLIDASIFADLAITTFFKKSKIEILDLSGNAFHENVNLLFNCMVSSSLNELILINCSITDEELVNCKPYFKDLPITYLNMTANDLTQQGHMHLAQALRCSNITTCIVMGQHKNLIETAIEANRTRIANQRLVAFQLYRSLSYCFEPHLNSAFELKANEISDRPYPDETTLKPKALKQAQLRYAGEILFSKKTPLAIALKIISKLPVNSDMLKRLENLNKKTLEKNTDKDRGLKHR